MDLKSHFIFFLLLFKLILINYNFPLRPKWISNYIFVNTVFTLLLCWLKRKKKLKHRIHNLFWRILAFIVINEWSVIIWNLFSNKKYIWNIEAIKNVHIKIWPSHSNVLWVQIWARYLKKFRQLIRKCFGQYKSTRWVPLITRPDNEEGKAQVLVILQCNLL